MGKHKYTFSAAGVLALLLLLMAVVDPVAAQVQDVKALAQRVLKNMGGKKGWDNTRFIAWTFNGQYQVWDKQQDRFRWEKDSLVAIINTRTKDGKVYAAGKEISDTEEKRKLLDRAYALWINNSYWLVMPFKLQDPGVNLKYIAEGRTMDGAAADILEMTFDNVGLTPENKYHLWIDKKSGLITQWAFYRKYTDKQPAFTRRWGDYKNHGSIKLASDRSNPQGEFKIDHIATPAQVPANVFNSPRPIRRL